MRLPKDFNEKTNLEQREWLANRKTKLENELEELKKMSRQLANGKKLKQIDIEDRPDYVDLKTGAFAD